MSFYRQWQNFEFMESTNAQIVHRLSINKILKKCSRTASDIVNILRGLKYFRKESANKNKGQLTG